MNPEELRSRLHGAMTALVTPFTNGGVDHPALRALVEWQVEQGIAALVPCGTTGEAPTLSWDERIAIVKVCVEVVAGRIPVIVGTGTNNTHSTVAFTAAAKCFGADAALIVTPYYNRPSQEGIFRHFQAVARQVDIPIIVYNVPSRTGVDLTPATLERLASIPSIIGIKDATGDLARPMALNNLVGERFIQLSGHDATAFGFNTMGGRGTISVVSNVQPRLCVDMHDACARGDIHAARAIHQRLRPLVAALELESNPVPVKYALHLAGCIGPDVRLPLAPVLPETADAIGAALQAFPDAWSVQAKIPARFGGASVGRFYIVLRRTYMTITFHCFQRTIENIRRPIYLSGVHRFCRMECAFGLAPRKRRARRHQFRRDGIRGTQLKGKELRQCIPG